jgi:hypothetical protein
MSKTKAEYAVGRRTGPNELVFEFGKVCEWKPYPPGPSYILVTSCTGDAIAYSDRFVFCPFCGKQIKVTS